jgi:hypothetical protein
MHAGLARCTTRAARTHLRSTRRDGGANLGHLADEVPLVSGDSSWRKKRISFLAQSKNSPDLAERFHKIRAGRTALERFIFSRSYSSTTVMSSVMSAVTYGETSTQWIVCLPREKGEIIRYRPSVTAG